MDKALGDFPTTTSALCNFIHATTFQILMYKREFAVLQACLRHAY